MIKLFIDSKKIDIQWLRFSDGAISVTLPKSLNGYVASNITYNVLPITPVNDVLTEIKLVKDALSRLLVKGPHDLRLMYLPYARADRVFVDGNPHPLNVFLSDISMMNFNTVYVDDPHNLKALEDFNNSTDNRINFSITSQKKCFISSVNKTDVKTRGWSYVIAPDKGAVDKASEIADYLGIPLKCASKVRDINTGRIVKTEIDCTDMNNGDRVIIVDDIFDGGGTFIPLCDEMKKYGVIPDLYVTHMIASRGLTPFIGKIDKMYFYNIVGEYINSTDILQFNEKEVY